MRQQKRSILGVVFLLVLGSSLACLSSGTGSIPVPRGAERLAVDDEAVEELFDFGFDEYAESYEMTIRAYELDSSFDCGDFNDTYGDYMEDLEADGYIVDEWEECTDDSGMILGYLGDEDTPEKIVTVAFAGEGENPAQVLGVEGVDGGFLLVVYVEVEVD
jgi:hypothetical protein